MRPAPTSQAPEADWLAGLYDLHGPRLFGYALMILADRAAAEDVVQQVFLSVLERRAARDVVRSPGDYLRRAVRNECYTWLRRKQRQPVDPETELIVEAEGGHGVDPDERIALGRALGALAPGQREVVHLKVFEGRTFAEIGELLHIPPNTAASRYRYALAHMKRSLSPRTGESGHEG